MSDDPNREGVMDPWLRQRLDELELEMGALQRELRDIRSIAEKATATAAPASRPRASKGQPIRTPAPFPSRERVATSEPRPRPVPADRRDRDDDPWQRIRAAAASQLSGARALAWAGGIVTLLGILFFFVLAVNRGWIGPGVRVACGAIASAIVFAAGVAARRRYGHVFSGLAAVGVGIAGGYATLLAATALYHLVPRPLALVLAAGIAALGLWVALLWSSELVAGLGLVGAILVPATVALQRDDVAPLGTAFVALVFAAAAVVAVRERWSRLLDVAAVAAVAQAAALVVEADGADAGVLAVTAAFWLLLLATAVAWQWRLDEPALAARTATYAVASAAFASLSAARLLDGTAEWATLLGTALAYLALALVLVRRERFRETGALVLAAALAVGGVAAADALSGSSLSVVWAAEGALLVWLAARTRELRFELAGFVYLAAAAVHALAVEASPDHLFGATAHPARGAQGAAAAGVAALLAYVFAGRTREPVPEQGLLRHLGPALAVAQRNVKVRREGPFHGGALLCLYAAALGILGLFQLGDAPVQTAFEHGQVVITAAWAAAALAAIVAAPALPILREAGYVWLALALGKLAGFDLAHLSDRERAAAALAVGAAALLAAEVDALQRGTRLEAEPTAALGVSVPCLFGATMGLTGGQWHGVDLQGTALLGLAAVYLAFAAIDLRRRRDFATVLWAVGLGIAAVGSAQLLEGSWLALAWAATAAATALLGWALAEERLALGAVAYLVLALAQALGEDAPPTHFFLARSHPASGVGAIVAVAAAALVVARFLPPHPLEPRARRVLVVGACVLAVYACSLGLLELFEHVGSAGVHTSFQRGHTAVSTFWALIGVAFLYVGLVRRRRSLRLGGLALLVLGLAKIFLYDLPNLSSVTRALSFLGVGALLLVAGFFYQRLNTEGAGGPRPAG